MLRPPPTPILASLMLALPCTPAPAGHAQDASASPGEVRRALGLMGTTLELHVTADSRATALAASEDAVRALEAAERRLSTWTAGGELAALNAQPAGVRLRLSPVLASELRAVRDVWRATVGAFDPTVGTLARAWGLRSGGRVPRPREVAAALETVGMGLLALDGDGATRAHAGLVLDEGGFGKGAGLDAALAALRAAGARRATLDLGGQLALLDDAPDAAPFEHALAHPRRRGLAIAKLRLGPGSLATSGNSERGITVEGVRHGHLLDPRTGRPAADFGSVTVWSESALRADALSTALFVMGPERALAWAAEHPGVEVLVAVAQPVSRPGAADGTGLELHATSGWRGRLETTLEAVDVNFLESENDPERPQ